MRSWFKLKRNKLYRRFMFDPHNMILKSIKLDKSFKNIITLRRWKRNSLKKKKILKYLKKLRKKIYRSYKKKYYVKKNLNKKFKKLNLKKKWYKNFWSKIKLNYFYKKKRLFKTSKKKETFIQYKKRRLRLKKRRKLLRKFHRKTRSGKLTGITVSRKIYKRGVRSRMAKSVWLFVKKSIKKHKTWWLLRITIRKTVIYFGFKNIKRFRFVNKYKESSMKLKTYSSNRLEFMLNIFLLKINIFDNIYVSNNFIKFSGLVVIDSKLIFNPFQLIKLNQIIGFSNLKKMQSIFRNRIMFSKYFFIKKYKLNKQGLTNRKLVKIIKNVPLYIHYDYQIMCFSMYRLPNKKEILSSKKGINDSWAIDTRLQYN